MSSPIGTAARTDCTPRAAYEANGADGRINIATFSVARASAAALKRARSRQLHTAQRWFFPAAALYAAAAVPLSLYGMFSDAHPIPGFAVAIGHGHELLFGYALAVAAGFLVNNVSAGRMWLLFGLWLAARGSYLMWPQSLEATATNVGFALLLAATVAPKMMKGAKKLRNKALGPTVAAIALTLAAFHVALLIETTAIPEVALQETVLLFALLMLFMGGRIIAPAIAAASERAGRHLEARIQPRIEGALLALMTAAIVTAAYPAGRRVAGVLLLAAALLTTVRLARWRVWRCWARPDLLCLSAGYAWLATGFWLLGGSWSIGGIDAVAAIHALTVGALGTLTVSVMARVRYLRTKRDPATMRVLPSITILIALAAGLRIGAGGAESLLWLAALCWSTGFLLLAFALFRAPIR